MFAPVALLSLLVQIAAADIGGPNATMLPSAKVNDGLSLGVGAAAVGAQLDGQTLALAGPEAHMGIGLGGHFGVGLGAGQLMGDRGQGLTCVNISTRLALTQGTNTTITPSVPVLSRLQYGDQRGFSALAPLFSEVGLSVGVADGQTLRLGTAAMLPGLSYQGLFGSASVEVAMHGLAWGERSAGFARASVAWTW